MCKICTGEINENSDIKYLQCKCKTLTTIPSIRGLKYLSCWYCPNIVSIPPIEGLENIFCSNCDKLTVIPCIQSLKSIYCHTCPLIQIPLINGLDDLNVCYSLTDHISPDFINLKTLACGGCTMLTSIPKIHGLQKLCCAECHNLTKIPHIDELQKLECFRCPNLVTIPYIEGLQELNCSDCPSLTNIPIIEGLQQLICYDCRLLTNIPFIENLQMIVCYNCPWLNVKNTDFDNNIVKLVKLQQWIKRILLSKKLKKIIPQLVPLYYHPDAKGGYLDKKYIYEFITKI